MKRVFVIFLAALFCNWQLRLQEKKNAIEEQAGVVLHILMKRSDAFMEQKEQALKNRKAPGSVKV